VRRPWALELPVLSAKLDYDEARDEWDNAAVTGSDGMRLSAMGTGQGLTLLHFSAQLERFLWDGG